MPHSFHKMTKDLYDIAAGIRGVSKLGQGHQDSIDKEVVDTLRDYSGIIHTLPVLVKLHEEAMEIYNASKEKDSVSWKMIWYTCTVTTGLGVCYTYLMEERLEASH